MVLQKCKSIQTRPKSQKGDKKLDKTFFEGSAHYPLTEPFLAEPFFKVPHSEKRISSENTKSLGFSSKSSEFSTKPL